MKSTLTVLLTIPLACLAGQLRIRVADENGRAIWSRLEIRGADGKMYQAPDAIRDNMRKARGGAPFYLGSFVVEGQAQIEVPSGQYTVIAEHGLEYERGERRVAVSAGTAADVSFRLLPWIRMTALGWYSGDVHIHRPLRDLPALAEAEDLSVSVVSNRNKQEMFEKLPWPANPVKQLAPDRLLLLTSAEDERRGGSWMLDGLLRPLALEPETGWYPPGIAYVRQARSQHAPGGVFPWFDIDMPIWWEVPVVMALETPDSLDILHNQFMQYGIDQSEYWGRPRDRVRFPGWQGFVDYSLGLYYRYLNLGFRVPPTAGTGTGVMPSPPGYDRVYAQIDGTLTAEKWFAAIRDGHSFVTNGPMLFFSVRKARGGIEAKIEALAREPLDRCEIVANGEILKSFPAKPGGLSLRASFRFDPSGHSWVAARCFLATKTSIRLAHSTPVYLEGKWDFRADAQYFADWIDALMLQSKADPKRFANDTQRGEATELYEKARQFYLNKLNGISAPGRPETAGASR